MDETTENCGILIQIKEEHVVTSCHFAFRPWFFAGGFWWPSRGGSSSGGRWFWWLTVCLGGGGGRRHCLRHVRGGQGAFVLAGQEKPSVVKANHFPMPSFTLRGDGCSDGGSGSVVHCLELKHVRVYPVLVHVGARDLVVCSARSRGNIFCWMNRGKNGKKTLYHTLTNYLVFTRNSTVSFCQTYSNAFPHQAAHIFKTFFNLQGPGDDCLQDPDFIYSLFKLDCRIIPGNTKGNWYSYNLHIVIHGHGRGVTPLLKSKLRVPLPAGFLCSTLPPEQEKIFQGFVQNQQKMTEKGFKMSKNLDP